MQGQEQLQAVASLLGFSPAALRAGLTTRTHNVRGQLVKALGDANVSRSAARYKTARVSLKPPLQVGSARQSRSGSLRGQNASGDL